MSDIQHFAKLIKEIKFAMFTTMDDNEGVLKSRPMTLQETEFDGDLWFFGGRSSEMIRHIEKNPKVNLAFANPQDSSYISASGVASVVLDQEKAKELWSPLYKIWFSEGLEDPNLCLIKVKVESAEYWESPSSPLVTIFSLAKAVLKGERANADIGRHGSLHLN